MNTDVRAEVTVMTALESISEVKETSICYGLYDIIVRLEAETMEEIKIAIQKKIRRINMVRSTITLIVFTDTMRAHTTFKIVFVGRCSDARSRRAEKPDKIPSTPRYPPLTNQINSPIMIL